MSLICVLFGLLAILRFLRFTCGSTPDDLLASGIAVKPFSFGYLQTIIVGLQFRIKCATLYLSEPSRSGRVVYSAVLAVQMVMGLSPKTPPMLVDMSASMWIEKAQLPCWPLYSQQKSHQRWMWGSHRQDGMQKGIHPGFETQGRHCQKSKTGVSVAPQKGLMSSKNFKKKQKTKHCTCLMCYWMVGSAWAIPAWVTNPFTLIKTAKKTLGSESINRCLQGYGKRTKPRSIIGKTLGNNHVMSARAIHMPFTLVQWVMPRLTHTDSVRPWWSGGVGANMFVLQGCIIGGMIKSNDKP